MVNKVDFARDLEAKANEIGNCARCRCEELKHYLSARRVENSGWDLCLLCDDLFVKRIARMLNTFFAPATKRGDEW